MMANYDQAKKKENKREISSLIPNIVLFSQIILHLNVFPNNPILGTREEI